MLSKKICNKMFYSLFLLLFGMFSIVCRSQDGMKTSGAGENANEVSGSREIHKSFTTESGKKLNIDLMTGGSISITGWEKDEIQVDAELGGDDWEDIAVGFEKSNSGLEINSRYKHSHDNENSNAHFDIKVPAKYDLEINTMGGELNIEGIDGKIQGKTMGGGLTLSNLKGYLDLTTMGGDISLTNASLDGKVHTMGGNVDFENVEGGIKGSSMGGRVTMNNVKRKDSESDSDEVDISSMGGEINVDNASNGANVSTMGGEINIHAAKKFVKAKTMGGSIKIDDVDGSVNASTMGGDINVTETCKPGDTGRDIELESRGGDITLLVPDGFSMDVDITLAITKENDGGFNITGDFEINKSTSDKWEHKNGSARKYIYGKASVNGGKNKVTIKTVNGNVNILKIK